MAYETLDVFGDAGGDVSPVTRSKETEYADGYKQVVFSGRQRTYDKVSFSHTTGREDTQPVYDLLMRSIVTNKPFYFRFAGVDTAKLYVVAKDSLKHAHIGGYRWSVTASFEEWNGLP